MSNGALNDPTSQRKWSVSDSGRALQLRWSSTVDTVRLDENRKRFAGNNKGARISGVVKWGMCRKSSQRGDSLKEVLGDQHASSRSCKQ